MASTAIATRSNLVTKFLKNSNLHATLFPLSNRAFTTKSPAPDLPNEEYCSITVGEFFTEKMPCVSTAYTLRFLVSHGTSGLLQSRLLNEFQKSGMPGTHEAKRVDEGLYVRMDAPGISKEGMRIWAEENKVLVAGDGRRHSDGEMFAKKCDLKIELCPKANYKTKEMKAELKHGVLRLVIPKRIES